MVHEVPDRSRERASDRRYVARARHFIVDPGLGLNDPGMVAAIDSSLQSMLLDWRRSEILQIDVPRLARRIAFDCARISAGETVLIIYGRFGAELGETLLVEVEAAGARGVIRPWSHTWLFRTMDRHRDEDLQGMSFVPDELWSSLDAVLILTTSLPEGAAPDEEQTRKIPAMMELMSRFLREVHRRRIRFVEFSLPFRSEFDSSLVSPEDGTTTFWKAVMTDLDAIGQSGGRLHERIIADPSLRMVCERGTELTLKVDPRTISVRDGVLTSRDVSGGRTAEVLPTGSLAAVPDPESVRGRFVADYVAWSGVVVRNPKLRIDRGRIIEIEGGEGIEFVREMMAGAKGDGDQVAMVTFGLNPAGRGPTGKPTLDSCLEGTVSLHFGSNELLGGQGRSTLNLVFPHTALSVRNGPFTLLDSGRFVWDETKDARPRGRYERSGLGPADIERIAKDLQELMERERPYLDSRLRRETLASRLAVSTNHLSQVLRQGLSTTFNDLVNLHRVEEFKRRVQDPTNRNRTHLALALDAGFPSKASFYRSFRKVTGETPAQFQERMASTTQE